MINYYDCCFCVFSIAFFSSDIPRRNRCKRNENEKGTYGIIESRTQGFQYARLLVHTQDQWLVHNARRCVTRECIVNIQKWCDSR